MRITGIFNPASLWRHFRRSIKLQAIVCSIQVISVNALPLTPPASAPTWKSYYDRGEQALAQEKPALAEECFRKALSLAQSNNSPDTEKCLEKLADVLALRNQTVEAQRLYQRLLGILVKKYGNSKRIVPVLLSLGSIQESLGDHKTAIAYYQRALQINEKNYGPYSPQFAENLHALARANTIAGDTGVAVKQYKQAISILMNEPSLQASKQLESVISDYSDLLKGRDDSDKTLIKDFKEDILNNPPLPANFLNKVQPNPGNKVQQVRPDQLDQHASGAFGLARADLSGLPASQFDRANLSMSPIAPGNFATDTSQLLPGISQQIAPQAEGPLERESKINPFALDYDTALAKNPEALNTQDSSMLQLRPAIPVYISSGQPLPLSQIPNFSSVSLAQPYSTNGQPKYMDSESTWHKQAAIELNASRRAQLDEEPAVVLRGLPQPWSESTLSPAYRILNESIFNQSRYENGEAYCQRKIAVDIDALGSHHPSVANDLNGLAQLYINKHDYAGAEPLLSRACAIYLEAYGADNILSINTCATYALVEFRLGKVDKAEALYRSALTHSETALGPNNFETARVLNELAYLYFYQGKLQQANTFYKWALASTEAAVRPDSPLLAACMQDCARVLRSLGQASEAEALDIRAESILIRAK